MSGTLLEYPLEFFLNAAEPSLLARLESVYSLIWGARQILAQGGVQRGAWRGVRRGDGQIANQILLLLWNFPFGQTSGKI